PVLRLLLPVLFGRTLRPQGRLNSHLRRLSFIRERGRRLPVPTGRDTDMTIRMIKATTATLAIVAAFACAAPVLAQDLGPNVRKLADGVYAFVGENYNSNAG